MGRPYLSDVQPVDCLRSSVVIGLDTRSRQAWRRSGFRARRTDSVNPRNASLLWQWRALRDARTDKTVDVSRRLVRRRRSARARPGSGSGGIPALAWLLRPVVRT